MGPSVSCLSVDVVKENAFSKLYKRSVPETCSPRRFTGNIASYQISPVHSISPSPGAFLIHFPVQDPKKDLPFDAPCPFCILRVHPFTLKRSATVDSSPPA